MSTLSEKQKKQKEEYNALGEHDPDTLVYQIEGVTYRIPRRYIVHYPVADEDAKPKKELGIYDFEALLKKHCAGQRPVNLWFDRILSAFVTLYVFSVLSKFLFLLLLRMGSARSG